MMKKTVLTMVVVTCFAATAQAKILRVNNVDGMAPYPSIQDAVYAANDGDTIMVDGSPDTYSKATIDKRIVLIGPGHSLRENALAVEDGREAIIDELIVKKEGTVIMGLNIGGWNAIEVSAPKVVITRCRIGAWELAVKFNKGANNCVLHQNYLCAGVGGEDTYNHQITNNVIYDISFMNLKNSYIAYNTVWNTGTHNCSGCLLERNFTNADKWGSDDNNNLYRDNQAIVKEGYREALNSDKGAETFTKTLPSSMSLAYGAFAGPDPYVVSGIPTAPVIEQLAVPASVEEGSKMSVTIKLGQGR